MLLARVRRRVPLGGWSPCPGVCARRGGQAGEDGGLRPLADVRGGGVGDLLFVRDGARALWLLMVGLGPGGPFCPYGEGSNCTLHMVFGGRRSEALGLPLGRVWWPWRLV
jgi:hypothetical protein